MALGGAAAVSIAAGAPRVVRRVGPPAAERAAQPAVPAVLRAGDYWSSLPPAGKDAYLTGFLAGAGAEQVATARAGPDTHGDAHSDAHSDAHGDAHGDARGRAHVPSVDGAHVAAAAESLHVAHALRFRFAPSVYASQLDDYYWWRDHASTPIIDAMTEINAQLLAQQGEGDGGPNAP